LTSTEVENWKSHPELVRGYFEGPQAPTAVLAWNDHEAVALLGHLARAGLRVPQDVSLVGYDNLSEGQLVHPALTTVETAVEQQLRAALEILTCETPVSPHHSVVVLPHLIPRDSSAAVG
jgi:LacI family transcriptional regulator